MIKNISFMHEVIGAEYGISHKQYWEDYWQHTIYC